MYPQHLTEFHGLPVFDLPDAGSVDPLPEPGAVAWRLSCEYDGPEDFDGVWQRFLASVDTTRVKALVFGASWREDLSTPDLDEQVRVLAEAAERFPQLRAFFLCDMVSEEMEISWIEQADIAPVLRAYPALEELGGRGWHTEFSPVEHRALRVLRLEAGGVSGAVPRGIGASELPALERLELWLGTEEYGGNSTVDDLAALLDGSRFPALRHLGLQNSDIQDAIAAVIAQAPVVPALETLSLSMGVLTDTGAEALLTGQPLTHLGRLDLHHHFLSDEMILRIRQALEPAGVTVDLSEQEKPSGHGGRLWHYVAVGE
jgi:hypothetical protein